ncbi:hypothetical protein [Microcoleus sp. F10-A1]|uniref:hypothetical protein n=1 Tax=Microcoleus sp. F10-A1 TaxID=2818750 RepID=UPI002FCFD2A2
MRTILALWHVADKGKTATLREFANLLLSTYPAFIPIVPVPANIPITGDFRLVVEINGVIIAVESQGDPNTNLRGRLIDLADNFHCDIILCSTRTKGDTIDAVDNLWQTRGFQTIWTSTYQMATNHQLVNRAKARHLLDLLQSLSLI